MSHILFIYKLVAYTTGVILLSFFTHKYYSTKNSSIKSFLVFWIAMTATSISYLIHFYMVKSSDSELNPFTYKIMLLSILGISLTMPDLVHKVYNLDRKILKYVTYIIHLVLSLSLFLPVENDLIVPILIMSAVSLSTIYSYSTALITSLKMATSIQKTYSIRLLIGFVPCFIALFLIDMRPVNDRKFSFFPVFYTLIGLYGYWVISKLFKPEDTFPSLSHKNLTQRFNLTKREREIALLLAQGMKYKEISRKKTYLSFYRQYSCQKHLL